MADEHGTALSTAHERFRASLSTRGRELNELVRDLEQTPGDERLLEQLRRRIHALYASAQLFREELLLTAMQPALARLDAAREGRRPPTPAELDSVHALIEALAPGGELSGAGDRPSAPRGAGSSRCWRRVWRALPIRRCS